MIPSKKGYIFEFILLIFTFGVLLFLILYLFDNPIADKKGEFQKLGLGKPALHAIRIYQRGEKALSYLDFAVLQAAKTAAVHTAKSGGGSAPCGEYKGYSRWNGQDNSNCMPDYRKYFFEQTSTVMGKYLVRYPYAEFPENNYELFIYGDHLIGTARKELEFTQSEYTKMDYSVLPSFNVDINYDINEYEALKEQAMQLTADCSGVSCVDSEITEINKQSTDSKPAAKWSRNDLCEMDENFILCFDVKSQATLIEEVIYKFAMFFDFPPVELLSVEDLENENNGLILTIKPIIKKDIDYLVFFSESRELLADISIEVSEDGAFSFSKENVLFYLPPLGNAKEKLIIKDKTQLEDGTPYYFTIRAFNIEGRLSDPGNILEGISLADTQN